MIEISFVNYPKVYMNGKLVRFPYKKLEYLFYYLFLEKESRREIIINYFWPELEEEKAKKNLRNALYSLKKIFGRSIFSKTPTSEVKINEKIVFWKDIEMLLSNEIEITGFFIGLKLNRLLMLEDYFEQKSVYIEKKIINELWNKTYENSDSNKIIIFNTIININSFQEDAYNGLIEIYLKQGKLEKAKQLYNSYVVMLKDELEITPEISFEALKNRFLVDNIADIYKTERIDLVQDIYDRIKKFNEFGVDKHILILGEKGFGKSYILNEISSKTDNFSVLFKALKSEKHLPYRGVELLFQKLLEKWGNKSDNEYNKFEKCIRNIFLDTLQKPYVEESYFNDHTMVENKLIDGFKKLAENSKISIFIDDFEELDYESKRVLGQLMHTKNEDNYIFILSVSKENIFEMQHYKIQNELVDKIEEIVLATFTKEMLYNLIDKQNMNIIEKDKNRIFELSEGNPMKGLEYARYLNQHGILTETTPNLKALAREKKLLLPLETQKIITWLCMFYRPFKASWILQLSDMKLDEIMNILQTLVETHWLKELDKEGEPTFIFTHESERIALLEDMSKSKNDFLNKRIRQFYRQKYKDSFNTDYLLYAIYHTEKLNDLCLLIEDEIFLFEKVFTYQRELFPILDSPKTYRIKPCTLEQLLKQKKKIENYFLKAEKENIPFAKYQESVERFHYLKNKLDMDLLNDFSAYKNMQCCYDEYGTIVMKFEVIKTIIYQAIDREDLETLEKFLDIGEKFIDSKEVSKYKPVWKRIRGYLLFQKGEYNKAILYINDALKDFEKNEKIYRGNKAGALYYLGLIALDRGEKEEAITYFTRAHTIAEILGLLRAEAVILSSMAKWAYIFNEEILLKKYILKAYSRYKNMDFKWKRLSVEIFYNIYILNKKIDLDKENKQWEKRIASIPNSEKKFINNILKLQK